MHALDGAVTVHGTPGWGSELNAKLPLDPPAPPPDDAAQWRLAVRELDVLRKIVAGQRNRSIAQELGISENTVKFHITNLFKKMGATSRAEVAALAHAAGLR